MFGLAEIRARSEWGPGGPYSSENAWARGPLGPLRAHNLADGDRRIEAMGTEARGTEARGTEAMGD